MTNYLGEDDDIDDFVALEKRIMVEDPHSVRQFAQMVKTQSPEIFARDNPADAFGDLDLGSCTNLDPPSPAPPSKVVAPKPAENQLDQYELAQQKLEERRRLVERAKQSLEAPKKEEPKQAAKPSRNLEESDSEEGLDGAVFQNPSLGTLRDKYSDAAGRGRSQQQVKPKIQQPFAEPSTSSQKEPSGNVVRIPAGIAGILQPTLQKNQQTYEDVDQMKVEHAQMIAEQDQKLRMLEQEIAKVKKREAELEKFESDLRLDFKAKLAEFEREKAEFKAWKKQQSQELKTQKQIEDDARKARMEKQQAQKQTLEEAEKFREENKQLIIQKANQVKLHKQQLEQLRKQLEEEVQANDELKQRLAEQDGLVVQLRKIGQQDQREIGALQQEIQSLRLQLKEAAERVQSQEQALRIAQQQSAQLQAQQPKPAFMAQQPQSQQTQRPIRPDAGQDAVKRLLQQMHDSDNKRQQPAKPAPIAAAPQAARSRAAEQHQWPPQIRDEFSRLPFLTSDDLFEQFDSDIDQYVNRQEQIKFEEKTDRTEERYASGARVIRFSNKTTKIVLPNNVTNIRFDNGDLKRVTPDGVVVYFYNDVGTLFTQMQEKGLTVKIYRFHNGQLEKHYDTGKKIVYYPEGTIKYVHEDGKEEAFFRDSDAGSYREE